MITAAAAVVLGLVLLVWSADRFVEGAAAAAGHWGVPPLLIGMVIIGFGTSAPELVVSAFSSWQGNPGLALGNAYGSNIANIALILGVTALVSPIAVHSQVLRRELPILLAVTAMAAFQLMDGTVSRADAWVLLLVFAVLMGWAIRRGLGKRPDAMGGEMAEALEVHPLTLRQALARLLAGLVFLVVSSRILVWGAVTVARGLGISDLVVGLTVVAVGTSLPELASSVMAARRNEHDLALGNVVGSNLFNTLGVVGLAGAINPIGAGAEVLTRDMAVVGFLTLSLFAIGYGFRGRPGRINRMEGVGLLIAYAAYNAWVVLSVLGGGGAVSP